jgi:hypothetical protein
MDNDIMRDETRGELAYGSPPIAFKDDEITGRQHFAFQFFFRLLFEVNPSASPQGRGCIAPELGILSCRCLSRCTTAGRVCVCCWFFSRRLSLQENTKQANDREGNTGHGFLMVLAHDVTSTHTGSDWRLC